MSLRLVADVRLTSKVTDWVTMSLLCVWHVWACACIQDHTRHQSVYPPIGKAVDDGVQQRKWNWKPAGQPV